MRGALETVGVDLLSIEIGRPECLMRYVDEDTGGGWYVIATSTKVDVKAVNAKSITDKLFAREKAKKDKDEARGPGVAALRTRRCRLRSERAAAAIGFVGERERRV